MNMPNNSVAFCDAFKLEMPVCLSITDENDATTDHFFDPDTMFAVVKSPDVKIRNGIGKNFKEYNLFDYGWIDKEPDASAFHQIVTFSCLFKSELKDLEKIASDNTTASLICGRRPKGFFKELNRSGYQITKCKKGIYHTTEMMIDIYIIVMPELGKAERKWLGSVIQHVGGACQGQY